MCYWPLMPLFGGMAGMTISAWAFAFFYASMLVSISCGWSMSHLAAPYSTETAVVMACVSVMAMRAPKRVQWLTAATLMTLPAVWSSGSAHHIVLAVPFAVVALRLD
jgi:hypothetical protein